MIKKSLSALFMSVLFIPVILLSSIQHQAIADELPQMIILKGDPGLISPETVKVKLGRTIIWYNNGPGPIKIKFVTLIGIGCSVRVNFYTDLMGNYETSSIPAGGIASICLIEEGEYDYEVRRLISKEKLKPYKEIIKGKIISTH